MREAAVVDFTGLASAASAAHVRYTFRFFDTAFTISTNQPESLIYFRKMYPDVSLQAPGERNNGQGIYYVINEPEISENPFIYADERIYPCPQSHLLPAYVYSVITNSIIARVRSHVIFHAAAVSWKEQGIMVLGAACQGKSTLTMKLIKRGFHFFTDDIACISRKDWLIYPFPRALGLRQSALELFKDFRKVTIDSFSAIPGGRKMLVNLIDIPEARVSSPCPLKFLICLSSPSKGPSLKAGALSGEVSARPGDLPGENKKSLYISTDRFEDGMINDLRALPGVEECEKYRENPVPTVRLIGRRGHFLLPRIEDLCRKHRVALVHIAQSEQGAVDYSQEPHLEKIPKSIAIRELLRSFRGGWTSSLLGEAQGGVPSILLELSRTLKGVDCYRITAGELEKMADLILGLADGGSEQEGLTRQEPGERNWRREKEDSGEP
ncbi:MAG: hypothetical protein AB1611_11890 [bacterium]